MKGNNEARSSWVMTKGRVLLIIFGLSLACCAAVRAQDQLAAKPAATPSKNNASAGTITGRVMADDGRPVPGAAVFFSKAFSGVIGPQRGVSTDIEGRFSIPGLVPGLYNLNASSPGYVIAPNPLGEQNEVKYYRPGDSVNVTLVKGGVITGTVRDATGEPLVAAYVRAVRVRDAQGRPLQRPAGFQMRVTDDRGIYRIYGLMPGTYIISAGGSLSFGIGVNPYENDSPTYYPSSTRDTAAEIPVRAGEELSSIDIRYRGEPGHTVSGTLTGADASNRYGISITLKQPSGGYESSTFVGSGEKLSFVFTGVADATYELSAQQFGGPGDTLASAPRRITVRGADLSGIELSLSPMGSIAGRVTLEPRPKEACAGEGEAPLYETVISARRDDKLQPQGTIPDTSFFITGGSIPNEQGEFTIRNLGAGGYRMGSRLPSESWYVRSIVTPGAAAAAPAKPGEAKAAQPSSVIALKLGEKVSGVSIQIAQDAAGIRGQVKTAAEGEPIPANLRVYLVPSERERAEDILRYSETAVAADGSFSLKNLAPGRYFLMTRVVPESEMVEGQPRPLSWDAASRTKLRREAEAANNAVELKPCQRVTDQVLRLPASK